MVLLTSAISQSGYLSLLASLTRLSFKKSSWFSSAMVSDRTLEDFLKKSRADSKTPWRLENFRQCSATAMLREGGLDVISGKRRSDLPHKVDRGVLNP